MPTRLKVTAWRAALLRIEAVPFVTKEDTLNISVIHLHL
jgi:hypothetical protein